MESLAQIMQNTGAIKPDYYLPIYEHFFGPLRGRSLSMLELGIFNGGSLKAWASYFPFAKIAGVDLNLPAVPAHERIHMFQGDQADPALLSQAAATVAPDGFDLIIDDCSHIGLLTKASFWHLFNNHLKVGGLYCIEDWNVAYQSDWPDGRPCVAEPDTEQRMPSHDAGMAGFIKQLVDEICAQPTTEFRFSKFTGMSLHYGLCIVVKSQW